MDSTNFERRLKELKRKCGIFTTNLSAQMSAASEMKGVFEAKGQLFKEQLDQHYMELIDRVMLNKKQHVELEADMVYRTLDERITQAMNEAHEIKSRLAELTEKYQQIVDDPYYAPPLAQEQFADDENDDALMINESVNEFDLNNNAESIANNSELMRLERGIEALISQRVLLSEITAEILDKQEAYYGGMVRLSACGSDFEGTCLGHLEVDAGQADSVMRLFPGLDLVDHTQFKFETDVTSRFLFNLNEKIKIDFACPYLCPEPERHAAYAAKFHENLQIKALDPAKNEINVSISEKIENVKHTLRIVLEARENAGIYEVAIKYKRSNIPGSPFHLAIVEPRDHSYSSSISSMGGQIEATPAPLMSMSLVTPCFSREAAKFSQNGVVSAGRGRVINKLRMKNLAQAGNDNGGGIGGGGQPRPAASIQLTMFPSQKRTIRHDEANSGLNHSNMDADDLDGELSSKLQKLVTGDDSNHEHSSLSRDEMTSSLDQPSDTAVNVVSDHLRKYAHLANRAVDRQMPPLKAEFVRKFSADFQFPIGVRPYPFRNWLIVCDSGNDSIKILDGNTGKLLRQITSQGKDSYRLKRPSAVLIDNDNQSDIYVKDDKEILVFDMNDNFRFIKKFGFGILHKPYGLAYNTQFNLVVVDADLRYPRVHVFDKSTGTLIKSRQYEPLIPQCANSSTLAELFHRSGIVRNGVAPMDKSKVRFIDCQHDTLYASDLGRSVVFKTNLDGEIELAFGHRGKRAGELNEPSGIHVERDGGAVLIGDSKNDRVQVYGPDGHYKCDVEMDEKIVRPSDIYVDDHGYLYVTCFIQHCIKKFKLVSN